MTFRKFQTTKQAQEVIFSLKRDRTDHPVVYLDEAPVTKASYQKHCEVIENLKFYYLY